MAALPAPTTGGEGRGGGGARLGGMYHRGAARSVDASGTRRRGGPSAGRCSAPWGWGVEEQPRLSPWGGGWSPPPWELQGRISLSSSPTGGKSRAWESE
ncbi:hypothetical protein P7K49_021813, partial [Saguinus oedipus]